MDIDLNDNRQAHHRHLRAGRQSVPLNTYAITKCVEGRRKLLANEHAAEILLSSFDYLRSSEHLRLLAFCVMPDHVHALFVLLHSKTLPDVLRSFARFTAVRINKLSGVRSRFWQAGFFDHRCRDIDDVLDRLAYIEQNPVRGGLTLDACDWPYSSACPANARFLDRAWFAERY